MHFASDNTGPAHPAVMEALMKANEGYAMPYGADALSQRVVEQVREVFEAPEAAVFLAATGKHDVLFAQLDLLHGAANTVGTGGAGGGNGIVNALDLERCGETRRNGAAHHLWYPVGTDSAHTLGLENIRRLDDGRGGGTAGAHHQTGAGVGYIGLFQPGHGDGFRHGNVSVGGGVAHKPQVFAVDVFLEVDIDDARDLAAQTQFGVFVHGADAAAAGFQGGQNFLCVDSDTGSDAHSGNSYPAHSDLQ